MDLLDSSSNPNSALLQTQVSLPSGAKFSGNLDDLRMPQPGPGILDMPNGDTFEGIFDKDAVPVDGIYSFGCQESSYEEGDYLDRSPLTEDRTAVVTQTAWGRILCSAPLKKTGKDRFELSQQYDHLPLFEIVVR